MTKEEIKSSILNNFKHTPTHDQETAITHLAAFEASSKPNPLYLLKGYAGTGKTSLISAFVKTLIKNEKDFVLLAPTGRAAKVLSLYTGCQAFTIHRYIYQLTTTKDGANRLLLAHNPLTNAVFIVDEASMIGDNSQTGDSIFGNRNLLDDLLNYVFSREGNKLLLVGDTAQLPPVGLSISPALDMAYLKNTFSLVAHEFEMEEVMRQSLDSGILASATRLREHISSDNSKPPFFKKDIFKKDIFVIQNGNDFEELLQKTYQDKEKQNGIVVCRTNKRANLFNKQVRNQILQRESELEGGDMLMVVKNNYFWLDKQSPNGFIANGDMVRVRRNIKTEEVYGLRFAEAEIEFLDYPEEKQYQVKILLDSIEADGPSISEQTERDFFEKVEQDYQHIPERRKRLEQMRKNPWLNALRVKFAYAMTCHKTQGGQWPVVIIDQGFIKDEMINIEFLRWLYTALTRATTQVYLVNFNEEFFSN
ncbi:MAG TPA: AAA family ATPase [Bacteroidales bacterium]